MLNRLMLINCPNCAKSYQISCAALGLDGRKVACPHCLTTWFAKPDINSSEPGEGEEACQDLEISAEAFSERTRPASYEELYGATAQPLTPLEHKPRHIRWPRTALLLTTVLGVAMSAIAFRGAIVRFLPRSNSIYAMAGFPVNQRGLDLQNVRVNLTHDGGQPILVVDGEIANLRADKAQVPELRLAVRDTQGQEIYTWDAASPKTKLASGETIAFRARLAAPPAEGHDVFVRFAAADPKPKR
jgi:predicted Zn finger-like uncharacterized protein